MSHELRAAADAFIFDVAMLLHVADVLGEEGMERRCDASGWTTRQTLGHLAANYERYAATLEMRIAGAPALPARNDPEAANPLIAEAERTTPLAELVVRTAAARSRIVEALGLVTPGQEVAPIRKGAPPLLVVVTGWSGHGSSHALDFIEAAPELARDALVLNWAYYPQPGEPPSLGQRREAMLNRLREMREEMQE